MKTKTLRVKVFMFVFLIFAFVMLVLAVMVNKARKQVLGISISNVQTDQKIIALTFDDGPSPQYTESILNVLKDKNIKATFFVVGENIDKYPEVLKRIHKEGHEIGNHGNSHKRIAFMKSQQIAKEILITEEKIHYLTNTRPTIFRVPYGLFGSNLPATTQLLNLEVIGWNVDSLDWKNPGVEIIIDNVIKDVTEGSIILMHDGSNEDKIPNHDQTLSALPQIIGNLQENGYSFVTTSELLENGDKINY